MVAFLVVVDDGGYYLSRLDLDVAKMEEVLLNQNRILPDSVEMRLINVQYAHLGTAGPRDKDWVQRPRGNITYLDD